VNQLVWMAILAAFALPTRAPAQVKVAEGEYRMRSSGENGANSTMDHWNLYTRKQGGYRLESEVTSAAGTGVIVIQTEELDDQLNPTSINLRLYTHEDTKKPFSALSCRLSAEQIACKAGGEDLNLAPETDQRGPILFAVNSLDQVDLMWMMASAIHRAHFADGKANVPTLVLQDGEDGPELAQKDVDVLRDEGKDKAPLEIGNAKIPARRYSFANSKLKCWIADSGLLLKMENENGEVIELERFKQYRKLIPELPVTP
jgi:hypothetical protein